MVKYVIYSIKDKYGKNKTDEKSLERLNSEVKILDLRERRRGQFEYCNKDAILITSLVKSIDVDERLIGDTSSTIQFRTENTVYSLRKV